MDKALNEPELIALLSAVADASKSIRTDINRISTPTAKIMQYEQMLQLVEMFQTDPDMVRNNLRIAKIQRDEYNKLIEQLKIEDINETLTNNT